VGRRRIKSRGGRDDLSSQRGCRGPSLSPGLSSAFHPPLIAPLPALCGVDPGLGEGSRAERSAIDEERGMSAHWLNAIGLALGILGVLSRRPSIAGPILPLLTWRDPGNGDGQSSMSAEN
jgi:hypothetical protein